MLLLIYVYRTNLTFYHLCFIVCFFITEHKFSDYTFLWHYQFAKNKFDTGKLWKVARVVVAENRTGANRLRRILKLDNKSVGQGIDGEGFKYPRTIDMVNRVAAVRAAVASKTPLAVWDNDMMKSYIKMINPKHSTPYPLERTRILEVMIDGGMIEFAKMNAERREELGEGFMSGTIDFWTDSHRKEAFGAFVIDMTAEKYKMADGSEFFMSRETREKLDEELFMTGISLSYFYMSLDTNSPLTLQNITSFLLILHSTGKPTLDCLEMILNFERFTESKTCTAVSDWMRESSSEAKVEDSDFAQLSADGASNAIGSVQEFEVLTRPERPNEVDFNVCLAHQNERSGGMASGTIKNAESNYELGAELKKNHEIQVRIGRAPNRMKVLREVQEKKGRLPILAPDPAAEVRWNSFVDEAKRACEMMGDLGDTIDVLLAKDGDDYDLLTQEEKQSGDTSRLTYTACNKKILRQYEGAATPGKMFSKFLQDRRNTVSYVLIEARLAVQSASSDWFPIHSGKSLLYTSLLPIFVFDLIRNICLASDISHMDRTTDLRKRGEKTVLVKKEGAVIDEETLKNYVKVEVMDSTVAEYCKIYAEDLAHRLQLTERQLPEALGTTALLNPLFGPKSKIVGAGMMTLSQYIKARTSLLSKMQDILDKKYPPICDSSSSESESSDDSEDSEVEVMPGRANANHARASEELEEWERWLLKKYRPKVEKSTARVLVGETSEISIGPLSIDGGRKNLPSGKNFVDYVDQRGRFDVLKFFSEHLKRFPTLWVIAQRDAAIRVVEVGCERFFGLSGYISSPRRTRLKVRTYERLAMLAFMVNHVYIDIEWVAKEYLRRCKAGMWKKENTVEALKCWNLERIMDAEIFGQSPPAFVTMAEFTAEVEYDSSTDA